MNFSKVRRIALSLTLLAVMLATVLGVAAQQKVRAAAVCTPTSTITTLPYAKDGAGDFCFQVSSLCTYINSWNMATLEVNGTAYSNLYAFGSAIAPLNGGYTIHYVGPYAWSHFEIGGPCAAVATSTTGSPATATRTATVSVPVATATRTATVSVPVATATPTRTAIPPTTVPPTTVPLTTVPPTTVPPTTVPPTTVPPTTVPGTWVHPGTLDSKADLDYAKAQLALGAQPYAFEFQTMRNNEGGLATAPTILTSIDANSGQADSARDQARRAYGNALAWYLTGQDSYAQQAIADLNAWSGLQSITATNEQNRLVAGWLGSLVAPAADIMLTYPGWSATDIAKMRAMFKRAFYPQLNTASTWNGNVDLHQISAMMAIAVFNEDKAEFDMGVARLSARMPAYFYLSTDTKPDSATWFNPTKWTDGLTQESCRDNGHHSQFALSGATGAMETAWHQGVDLYSTYRARMVPAMELMALQLTSGSMQGTCGNNTSSADVYDTWEIGYNHYHNISGVSMPNTLNMILTKVRSYGSNGGSWNIFYESLTHAK